MTIRGTTHLGCLDATLPFASLVLAHVGTSFYALVGAAAGSQAHGLASTPKAVMITPVFAFGTFGAPYQREAADATNVFVSAGTTGTVQITAIA